MASRFIRDALSFELAKSGARNQGKHHHRSSEYALHVKPLESQLETLPVLDLTNGNDSM